jgi:hypothetical protein
MKSPRTRSFEVPVLREDQLVLSNREVQVDVSRDPVRYIRDRSRAFYIPGVELTFHLPFQSDLQFFRCQPSTHNLNHPVGDVREHELQIRYTFLDDKLATARPEFDRNLANIKQNLGWLNVDIERFNQGIGQDVNTLLTQRGQQLEQRASAIDCPRLSVKIRGTGSANACKPTCADEEHRKPQEMGCIHIACQRRQGRFRPSPR